MKKNRYILSILVVLIIFLIATISALVLIGGDKKTSSDNTSIATQPITITNTQAVNVTTDPYKDWKSYKIDMYDISFKYPADWTVRVIDKANGGNDAEYISCNDSNKQYFKDYTKCNGQTITVPQYQLRYTGDFNYPGDSNTLDFSISGNTKPSQGELSPIDINGQNLEVSSYTSNDKNISNDGFYLNGINTGKNSIFSSFNVYSSSVNKANDGNINTLSISKDILRSIK